VPANPDTQKSVVITLSVPMADELHDAARDAGIKDDDCASEYVLAGLADRRLRRLPEPPPQPFATRRRKAEPAGVGLRQGSALSAAAYLSNHHHGPNKKLSTDDVAMIVRMRAEGEKTRAIAARLGVSMMTVRRYARRAKMKAD